MNRKPRWRLVWLLFGVFATFIGWYGAEPIMFTSGLIGLGVAAILTALNFFRN